MPGQENQSIAAIRCQDTITLWHGRCEPETFDYPYAWQLLDKDEQAHALQIKNEVLHKRYVYIHGQLRQLLAATLQQAPHSIAIHKATHGKPYLADYPQLAFNLSHADHVFVIALGWHCQLGVDVEILKPRLNFAGLVKKCFAPEEALYWQQLPEEQKPATFYRFWTRKEAFVKATGFGISLGLRHCVVNPLQPDSFLRMPAGCGDAASWYLRDFNLPISEPQGFYGALCSDKQIRAIVVNEI